jgi:DNA polymerase I
MPGAREKVYVVDGSAQFHRAYFAIRGLTTSRGLPTNATYGFTSMLRKLLEDEQPRWIGISFDLKQKTFRHEEYKEYKANRPRMDEDLAVQLPYVRRVCEAFRLPILELAGFEADDVIASLARQAVEQGHDVVVVSGDKDLLQLVDERVKVLNPGREGSGSTLYDRQAVEEKFGVPPESVVDMLALVGDAVDNVPGVPGIGDKGARDLVREFGSLDGVLENVDKIKRKAYREGLEKHRDDALLSRRLVTLRRDAPISLDLDALRRREPDLAAAHALFSELEFVNLAKEFTPQAAQAKTEHRLALEPAEVAAVVAAARAAGRVALAPVTTSEAPMTTRLLGLALAWESGRSAYVPLGHSALGGPDAAAQARALEALRPLLEDAAVKKLGVDGKRDRIVFQRHGVAEAGLAFDALLAAYLLNPGRRSYALEDLALEVLGVRGASEALSAAGPASPVETVAPAAGQQADLLLRLAEPVSVRLGEAELLPVFEAMELPLVEVLAGMELAGVKVDVELLGRMSREMQGQIENVTREIYALAGGEFNVNSPPQLRAVLFDRLGLKSGKKTAKTRAASTAEDVLEELALHHELPRKIIEYRQVQKLKSTYVDALPALVNPETGRIHASFNQAVAATGRISSSDPNLQNIPIRTPEGRRIREAFVAERGWLLLSADYSQIELRILAHLSKDATLIDTFRRGEDVHDRTAHEVFGPFSPMPRDEQRRVAKMVNYALLYGKTAFTLAKDLGVSRGEAAAFIDAYFARYPSVRGFIDDTIQRARETGHVRTLLGRLRRLPELKARNPQVRMEAERQAMNTPVQGSAADLIKKAMLDLHRALGARRMQSRLVLQIHDELLLEVPEAEKHDALELVQSIMQGALELDVPLVVDARLGPNWAAAH